LHPGAEVSPHRPCDEEVPRGAWDAPGENGARGPCVGAEGDGGIAAVEGAWGTWLPLVPRLLGAAVVAGDAGVVEGGLLVLPSWDPHPHLLLLQKSRETWECVVCLSHQTVPLQGPCWKAH